MWTDVLKSARKNRVTKMMVAEAYRGILGREPESDEVIAEHQACGSLSKIVRALAQSHEFKLKNNLVRRQLVVVEDFNSCCVEKRIKLAVPPGDWMLQEIIATRQYEPYVMAAFMSSIGPESHVVDMGANIGAFTICAATKAKSVLAIEASADNAKIIALNATLNQFTNISILPVALSDSLGIRTFGKCVDSNKIVRPLEISVDSIDEVDVVVGIPTSDILKDREIDVVKIDVEGSEYLVLKDADCVFEKKPVFFTEYSPDFVAEACGVQGEDYLDLFFRRGYEAVILHRDMSRERAGRDAALIRERWRSYMARQITHLDLMMMPA
jgi:FkbM family methyltransferase